MPICMSAGELKSLEEKHTLRLHNCRINCCQFYLIFKRLCLMFIPQTNINISMLYRTYIFIRNDNHNQHNIVYIPDTYTTEKNSSRSTQWFIAGFNIIQEMYLFLNVSKHKRFRNLRRMSLIKHICTSTLCAGILKRGLYDRSRQSLNNEIQNCVNIALNCCELSCLYRYYSTYIHTDETYIATA